MTPFTVRLAERAEEDAIFEAVVKLHSENGLFVLSERKVRATLQRAFDGQEGAGDGKTVPTVIGVIGELGKIEASIGLEINQPSYSDEWQISELWNFVDPDYREAHGDQKGRAATLIDFAKGVSDKMHLPLIIGIVSNHRTEAKIRLYERQLEKAGAFFCYNRQYTNGPNWPFAKRVVGEFTVNPDKVAEIGEGDLAKGRKVLNDFIKGKLKIG